MKKRVYEELASLVEAVANCEKSGNTTWRERHTETILDIMTHAPHGSGFDMGCALDMQRSHPNRLIISAPFHHMDQNGMYDHWGSHEVWVTPSLARRFDMRITARDYNGFKEYAYEVFDHFLNMWYDTNTGAVTEKEPEDSEPCQATIEVSGLTSSAG